jgi:hypothetical protein
MDFIFAVFVVMSSEDRGEDPARMPWVPTRHLHRDCLHIGDMICEEPMYEHLDTCAVAGIS